MKPRKVKSYKSDTVKPSQMILRMVDIRRETFDEAAKSVEVVIASENPVERYFDEWDDVANEILSMDGVEFRTDKRQLPIVDSHDRSTVRNVLGSVRNVRVEGSQLVGDAMFARDSDSQEAFQKLMDGHLTDFSITATPSGRQVIRRGESGDFRGSTIQGPAVIVTRWTPTDASLVATGADETSTVRELLRSYHDFCKEVDRMLSEETKAALVAKGMPEQLDDAEQALAWVLGVMKDEPAAETVEMAEEDPVEEVESMDEEKPVEELQNKRAKREGDEEELAKSVDRALKADRKRRREIVALCTKAKLERAFADKLCDDGVSLSSAREQVLERMMDKPVGTSRIEFTASAEDKRNAAMRDGLLSRAFVGAGVRGRAFTPENKPAVGSDDFKHMSLLRMAETSLRWLGIDTERMSNRDIAAVAMGSPGAMDRYSIRRDQLYHTTGTFPRLMLDAANKTLLQAYEEAPYTWQMWARQASSVPDFKNVNRIRFSESPDLEMIPQGHDYKEKAFSDQKESYAAAKYGALFTVTWETVVNDDLDAISRVPAMHGVAARRKQNKTVYDILTANATMSDSVALFGSHASGTNLDASGAAPSVAELNAAFTAMMTQKGLSSDVIINVQPRYLIVPAALAATALQLVTSLADPSNTAGSTEDAARPNRNSGTNNIYGPNGVRPLQVVVEPYLDGNSATAWYLSADPSQIDTVELAFLQGEESPVLEQEWDFDSDGYKYKIRQSWGAKAIDWRGLYKNPGT